MTDALLPIELTGSAWDRGRQQALARPHRVAQVRAAVSARLQGLAGGLQRPDVQAFLHAQQRFMAAHDPSGAQEIAGIAEGYGLPVDDLVAYLHGNIVADMALAPVRELDGCTAWAQRRATGGALVVKNRDYRGEHGALQQLFLHSDPAWQGRRLLCLGSLGSPGAFSSGMNSDGLALVDTQTATTDHGPGWLRYLLMTALLRECATVDQALAMVAAVPHAGGGTLLLADRQGQCAAVELGHCRGAVVDTAGPFVARTNHCTDAVLAAAQPVASDELARSSRARLAQVQQALSALPVAPGPSLEQARSLMASHDLQGSICLHADADGARTLSCVVYDTQALCLDVSQGSPCSGVWSHHQLTPLTPSP